MRGQRAEQYIANADRTQPVVYLSGEPLDGDVETVQADVRQGAADLARYLVRRGYRRPRYVPAYVQTDQEERTIAYRAVMQEAGLPLEIRPLEPEGERRTHAVDAGLRLATVRARERPDVVLCHNDVTAIGMIHGLRRGGLRIPEDIAVVGFDGTEEGQFLDRPLTTVRMPLAEMSERAVHRLRELIENPNLERSTQVFATGLVIGETA
jgi:DNA-binding LacI/PurR family transcriptional regulator